MRIVLSRKGFDSANGGIASPILPNGAMVSLPIPAPLPTGLHYRDIVWQGRPLSSWLAALGRPHLDGERTAHLDPDLDPHAVPRLPGWRAAFGQQKGPQRHLRDRGVGPGDLFLFFGWFRTVQADGDLWRYARDGRDEHVLFGWLQVGEVLAVDDRLAEHRAARPWLARHPHLVTHAAPGNCVYVAAERLVLAGRDMGAPGGGVFGRYRPALRLSCGGGTRSMWRLPPWLHPDRGVALSFHGDRRRWSHDPAGALLRSAPIGQEFVATAPAPLVAEWMATLLPGVDAPAPPG